ncbi:MAG TPA: site-2 protease family protein [Planctomycetota bacterium]|nr:site-2 protease family protein [Planctomycetota bacterium]
MKWSVQIARIFGIPIRLHLTFLLLLAFLTVTMQGKNVAVDLRGVLMVVLLFGCVLLHELSHSLMALQKGIKVHSITLMPIGGVAQLATLPENPNDEVKIAIAGPAISYLIASAVLIGSIMTGQAAAVLKLPDIVPSTGKAAAAAMSNPFSAINILSRLFWANIMLGTLNLLPAFPMDGGRVLRGLLAKRMGLMKATQTAVKFGQAFAMVMYFLGALYYQSLGILILIAVFIYLGAGDEEEEIEFRSEIADIPARDAMLVKFDTLSPHMAVPRSLDVLRHSGQEEFPVLDDGKLVGMVSKNDVLTALQEMPPEAVIGEIMRRDFVKSTADAPLGSVLRQMELQDKDMAPVLDSGKVVGLLSFDQIGRYYSLATKSRQKE